MKIVTASNGKKTLTISRKEWENIGKKAGFIGNTSYKDQLIHLFEKRYGPPGTVLTPKQVEEIKSEAAAYRLDPKLFFIEVTRKDGGKEYHLEG